MSGLIQKGKCQFFDGSGMPLAGGSVTFYVPGTTTFKDTYQDSGLSIVNPNPVILDANGEALVWGTGLYTQIVADSLGNQVWSATAAAGLSSQDVQSGAMLFGLDTGTANNYIVNRSTPANALVDGMQCWFKALNANTEPSVLTVDGLATTPIDYEGGVTPAGLITAGGYFGVQYQAANNVWSLIFMNSSGTSEWVAGPTPTFISATQFSLPGDCTGSFQVNRRVQITDNQVALYGTITASSYTSPTTTVTVALDSGTLDTNLTAASVSFLNAVNTSIPSQFARQDQTNNFAQPITVLNAAADQNPLTYAQALGVGQVYHNVTSGRTLGTTYTNSGTSPIFVVISVATNGPGTASCAFWVAGVQVAAVSAPAGGSPVQGMFIIVPPGQTYSLTGSTVSLSSWFELS